MKIFFTLYLIFGFLTADLKATTWVTAGSGEWNNPLMWVGNVVPPYESSDNFDIKHPISFDQNLTFKGSQINIQSSGALCGHKTVTVRENCTFNKYGPMFCDTLVILSSKFNANGPGTLMVSGSQLMSGNGSSFAKNQGCAWCVRCYFSCTGEQGFHASGVKTFEELKVEVFPNPASNKFQIKAEENIGACKIKLSDLQGKEILSTDTVLDENGIEIPVDLENGLYFYEIISGEKKCSGILQIIR